MFTVVGLSAYFHDSACCVLRDGELVAAAQEERFSRVKHDASLPLQSYKWCLAQAGVTAGEVDCVAYYEDPWKKLERRLWQLWPAMSVEQGLRHWQRARLPVDSIREVLGHDGDVECCDHHLAHAASAFFFSGYRDAAVLTVDSVGEWTTTAYAAAHGDRIEIFEEVEFPNSLGLLYSTLTSYLGFAVNDGEYKVMGLAPYGQPRYVDRIRELVESEPAGQFRLNLRYFDFTRPDRMYSDLLPGLFSAPARRRGEPLLALHRDIARSLQLVLEEILLEKVRYLHDRVPVEQLCMAGGVALNCVANGRILRDGPFRRLFVQPAAGDAGGAVGAAALAHARRRGAARRRRLDHVYLGPGYSATEVAGLLASLRIAALDYRGREHELLDAVVARLVEGKVVAWFQGRMEFGPRALGARSILADPRDPLMRDRVNASIKERESFRPFAPAVIDSLARYHFDLDHASPFMLETCRVLSSVPLPAVTHVDGSARVQTVAPDAHPRFWRLLQAFHARTGCPMLLNTSFNLRDEPIVATPADALSAFARTPLDALVVEDFIVDRSQLDEALPAGRERVRDAVSRVASTQVYPF